MDFFKNFNIFNRQTKNSNTLGSDLGNDFLRNGSRKTGVMQADWSSAQMTDFDFYTGYSYAAINNRANKVAHLAVNNLYTSATPKEMKKSRSSDVQIVHPYLKLINESSEFTPASFWYALSTYIDLEGVYYLYVHRAIGNGIYGTPQYFKMLNPYNVKRVLNQDTMEVGGYVETRGGLQRVFDKDQIIEIRKLNPFSEEKTFSMTDAAKEYQFAIKQAGDFTRSSLKNNIASPGIISTDVILDDEKFANFKARVLSQEKGMPLFANGAGGIDWKSMQIDMDKAALSDINEINRSTLFAVSGVSKTTMGIEESGTTREVSRTQKDKFIEDHIMPQTQLIIDALNQDYRTHYASEFEKNQYIIKIDSPMAADKDAEKKDVEIAQAAFELYDQLVKLGYDHLLAAKYSKGEIQLADLGEPVNEPVTPAEPEKEEPKEEEEEKTLKEIEDTPDSKKKDSLEHDHSRDLSKVHNEIGDVVYSDIQNHSVALENSIRTIDNNIISQTIRGINLENLENPEDALTEEQKKNFLDELNLSLETFYLAILPLYSNYLMRKRSQEYEYQSSFVLSDSVKSEVKSDALSAARSHFNTVVNDILISIDNAYQESLKREVAKLKSSGVTDDEILYKTARINVLQGKGMQDVIESIRKKQITISEQRAKTIAFNEANRVFNMSQYQADLQFLNSSGLIGKAYKQWVTTSGDPCVYCQSLASRGPIPFTENFVDLGGEISTTYQREDGMTVTKKMTADYGSISSGNAHVNCSCHYKLIIK